MGIELGMSVSFSVFFSESSVDLNGNNNTVEIGIVFAQSLNSIVKNFYRNEKLVSNDELYIVWKKTCKANLFFSLFHFFSVCGIINFPNFI